MLWQIMMLWLGTLSLIYYLILRIMTKKWNSTFSYFWLSLGTVCLCTRALMIANPGLASAIEWRILIIPLIIFGCVEFLIFSGMMSTEEKNLPYIIVLGAQIKGRQITDSLMWRLDRACTYLKENPETKVIVSGGQGSGEDITEAEAMAGFLVVQGIDKTRIIREDASRTTKENLKFSAVYIDEPDAAVGIVTNNFHMYRACRYARKLGYKNVRKIPAGCHALLFLNYIVREFFAVVKLWIT